MISLLFPPVLLLLDGVFYLRRIPKRLALANLTGICLVAFMAMGMVGMWQFTGIASDIKMISKDILVSMGATRDLRTSIYEFRLHLLREGLGGRQVPMTDIDNFEKRVHGYLKEYSQGVFNIEKDRDILHQLEIAEGNFSKELHAKNASIDPTARAFELDAAAEPLGGLLQEAASFNTARLRNLSEQTAARATAGLASAYLIWIAFICMGAIGFLLIFVYRWLDEMER